MTALFVLLGMLAALGFCARNAQARGGVLSLSSWGVIKETEETLLTDGAVIEGDAIDGDLFVRFDHNVAQAEIAEANCAKISLVSSDGTSVAATVWVKDTQLEFQYRQYIFITVNQELDPDQTYSIVIEPGIIAKNGEDIYAGGTLSFGVSGSGSGGGSGGGEEEDGSGGADAVGDGDESGKDSQSDGKSSGSDKKSSKKKSSKSSTSSKKKQTSSSAGSSTSTSSAGSRTGVTGGIAASASGRTASSVYSPTLKAPSVQNRRSDGDDDFWDTDVSGQDGSGSYRLSDEAAAQLSGGGAAVSAPAAEAETASEQPLSLTPALLLFALIMIGAGVCFGGVSFRRRI